MNSASDAEPPLTIGNEFAEVRVRRVRTRNGARLLIESVRTGDAVSLCPLELEALTRQGTATFSAMIGHPDGPLVPDAGPEPGGRPGSGAEP